MSTPALPPQLDSSWRSDTRCCSGPQTALLQIPEEYRQNIRARCKEHLRRIKLEGGSKRSINRAQEAARAGAASKRGRLCIFGAGRGEEGRGNHGPMVSRSAAAADLFLEDVYAVAWGMG
jgi:hypothetical protein